MRAARELAGCVLGHGERKTVLGCKGGFGPKEEKVKEGKNFFLPFSKELTKLEFKHKFEFKQMRTMQQHECNSKLLYFINLIEKN
jgi:hypothetical protein